MRSRVLVVLPLVAVVALVLWWSNASPASFGFLWNYFAWLNQTLVATTLMACTVWLLREGKDWRCVVTLLPIFIWGRGEQSEGEDGIIHSC